MSENEQNTSLPAETQPKVESVKADVVNFSNAAAETIQAELVRMRQGGAETITAQEVEIRQGGSGAIQAENALDSAWEALLEITGSNRSTLATLGDEMALNRPAPDDIAAWSETAQEQNYAIIAARNATELARKNIDVNKSGHYPTLDLVGSYGIHRTDSDTGSDADTGIIGLQLNVPLYTGGATSSSIRQAEADFRTAQYALDQQRRAIGRQVRDAYRGVISSISQVDALKAATISADSALKSTNAGYEVGTRTIVDVLTVQRNLFDSQRNYFRSRYDYIINSLSLKQAAGNLSRKDLERVNRWLQ